MPENRPPLPGFTGWPSFPFEGDMRVKLLAPPVPVEPPRSGEDAADCVACNTPDDAYIWVSERWRVRAMDQPTGLPAVLVLECRSHLDLGDLTNLLAAELGVMTVRVERAIRSLDGVARVHVNRWGDGSAHLHLWFLARPYGRLQLRGTFLSLWDDILPAIPERQWRENLGIVAAWLAEFGGTAIAEPPHIAWQAPGTMGDQQIDAENRPQDLADAGVPAGTGEAAEPATRGPGGASRAEVTTHDLSDAARRAVAGVEVDTLDLSAPARRISTTAGDTGRDAGTGTGRDAGTGTGRDAGTGTGRDAGGDAGTGTDSDAGTGTDSDAGTGTDRDAGTDAGTAEQTTPPTPR